MPRRSEHPAAALGERLLGATIIAAPLAAGGFRLEVLPLLALLAALAYVATLVASVRATRPLHIHALGIGLLGLVMFTAAQGIPLSEGILSMLSPRAAEVRAFVGAGGGPLTYELGATWREVAKLILYGLVAVVAFERARANRNIAFVAYPIVIAGIATAAIAIVHRVLGIERLFGLIEARGGSTSQMLTTFVNPNHAAGFMGMAALTAIGLALDQDLRQRRIGLVVVAGLFGAVSVLVLSRGGLVALVFGLALFGLVAVLRKKTLGGTSSFELTPALLFAVLIVPLLGILWRAEAVIADFGIGEGDGVLGLSEKLAAVRDSIAMVSDHPWLGVGRGAYVSVYTAYKTSDLQLTFAFPENIAAQLSSEWGVVVGLIALCMLLTAVLIRLRRATSWTAIGATCGVALIVVQNVVDFSLEMPGVAIPVAAILGAAGARIVQSRRLRLSRGRMWGAVLIPVVSLAFAIVVAIRGGDLFDDLAKIDSGQTIDEAALLARHPASALVAARLAYHAENDEPPRLTDAIRHANRAMYLAPTYAAGHLLTGRLLIRAGHRRQGFGELRRAWSLAPSSRGAWIDHVIALAKRPDEVVRAIPRRDEALDILDELEASRAIIRLVQKKRPDWGLAVIDALGPVDGLAKDALTSVALAATKTGSTSYAFDALDRRLELDEHDGDARVVLAKLLMGVKRFDDAERALAPIVISRTNAPTILMLRYRLAMSRKDFVAARATLDSLEEHSPPTLAEAAHIGGLRADLERAAGAPAKAIAALDDVLAKIPGDIRLRMKRAQILLESGRHAEARVDAEFVLRRSPDHGVAKSILQRTRGH